MKLIPIIFLLHALSFASLSSLVFTAGTPETIPDYFSIVFQWPKTKCESKEGCCLPKKGNNNTVLNDFIISEFIPVFAQYGFPSSCNSTTEYQPSKIADLIPSLERNWPSLSCPSRDSKKQWNEEWYKNGICSESVFSVHDYFAAALRVQRQINLLKVFSDAGIKPNGTYYPGEQINKVIKKAGLGECAVSCREDENGLYTVLDQVTLCGTIRGNKYPCPGSFWICDSRNGNAVKFPSPMG